MNWAWWAALASASAMVQEMPEEGDANGLRAKFRQRYARKGLPVVMRGTEDGPTFDEVGEMCPDVAMEAYEMHAEGKGWAGFSDAKPARSTTSSWTSPRSTAWVWISSAGAGT